jgi:hypothetical protein
MPLEQDIPAPVTTTIFLPLATDSEIADSVRLVWESVDISSILRVTVVLFFSMTVYNKGIQLLLLSIVCSSGSSRVERSRGRTIQR